jgi:hypothetical protein
MLNMWPCKFKLNEIKHSNLAQQNGFGLASLHNCIGWYKAQQSLTPTNKKRNKYDLIVVPCF